MNTGKPYPTARGHVLGAVLPIVLFAAVVAPRAAVGQAALPDLAEEVRSVLGLDVRCLAALGVSPAEFDGVASAAANYVRLHQLQIAPLVTQRAEFRSQLVTASSSAEAYEAAVSAADLADDAILQVIQPLATELGQKLSVDKQAILQRWSQNPGVDPLLRFVEGLTEAQLSQLRAATLERDRYLRHPRNWHREAVIQEIWQSYNQTLLNVLTPQQFTAYQAIYESADANQPNLVNRDAAFRQALGAQSRNMQRGRGLGTVVPSAVGLGMRAVAQRLRDMIEGWSTFGRLLSEQIQSSSGGKRSGGLSADLSHFPSPSGG